jgi:hypothetical protein
MFDEVPEPVWKTSIELPARDTVGRGSDPLRLAGVEQAELGVHPRRRSLDPSEPAGDRRRDGLTRDREVLDRLAGLLAPELVLDSPFAHVASLVSRQTAAYKGSLDPAQTCRDACRELDLEGAAWRAPRSCVSSRD